MQERPSQFERCNNLSRFVFETLFTRDRKQVIGDVTKQCMRKTILTDSSEHQWQFFLAWVGWARNPHLLSQLRWASALGEPVRKRSAPCALPPVGILADNHRVVVLHGEPCSVCVCEL